MEEAEALVLEDEGKALEVLDNITVSYVVSRFLAERYYFKMTLTD